MTKEEAVKLIDERMCFGRGKWSEHHMPEIDYYWKAGQMAIKALEQPEQKWIPCSERLPEDDDKVLCMTKTKKGNLNHVVGYHYSGGWACGMNRNVIAWMPLPEPYEEGE